jgi:hypothetical protein
VTPLASVLAVCVVTHDGLHRQHPKFHQPNTWLHLLHAGVGLWGSVKSLMNDLDAGGEGWGCYKDPLLGFTVPQ